MNTNELLPFTIVEQNERKMIGLKLEGPYTRMNEIGMLWETFNQRVSEIDHLVQDDLSFGIVQDRERDFTYYAAVEVSSFTKVPEGMATIILPACRYAVFTHKGPQNKFSETVVAALKSLKESGYEKDSDNYWLEGYDDHRFSPELDHSECDIYFPLKAKTDNFPTRV
ncbi:GyrI-like domain-containing protein [Halalkalibacterium halodurans]|uniref:GyrI-like domain-containing protein n=1 Tax=Halalkalibacterium halodurans TaxID=86665 RepID=UPI002E1B521A|nr:GyrI-like domain-containing protein [Halalkalibacterium halodurans]